VVKNFVILVSHTFKIFDKGLKGVLDITHGASSMAVACSQKI
jgi:hypothetical protein